MCDNNQPKLGLGFGQKGKEVVFSADGCSDLHQEKWVERDFLNLSETKSNSSSKRNSRDKEKVKEKKKPKLEGSLNLSLALPDVSLSLTAAAASNALQNGVKPKPVAGLVASASVAPAPSFNNTQTTCSDDFTAPYSLSCSFSHAFSHNPSCSMTRNSTENYDYSVGRDDPIWCGGEGTNGSVHSRFRPIGEGILALHNNNNGGINGGFGILQGNRVSNKESCINNSVGRATSSDNISFFPSELPARPRMDTYPADFRKKESENMRGLEDGDGGGGGRGRSQLSRPERIVREIVSESVPVMAQIIQELTQEMLNSIKDYVKSLVSMADKKEELISLQSRLGRRSDLTKESLLKCQKDQLEILVAVKMGLGSSVSGKVRLATTELIEMFLYVRCRNVNCKSILPVEDCECKFCSANNGFCSSCMCPVCMKFDCASNTCSWVGCDVCSHWCHAACGIQKNLIRPGPSLKGPPGTNEIQFHCIACNHASEMFGFVKDVFTCCAKDWGFETLLKELDCVRKIFKGSDDFKGKELHTKADGLISKLESKLISPSDACHIILKFFDCKYPLVITFSVCHTVRYICLRT
ncbi:unnamed protein product [Linum tenue]|uniref:Oberon-like PHD finger domain-containing protein n=1 Tax=Linum tenue TaxID=586396 RepID=A0AAV0NFX2_9ROSI|nr:unnamed protein product [Linum tenue]